MMTSGKTMIVAHRGGALLARENTLEAFSKAIKLGVDMVEMDVRKTKDGVLVAHHDAGPLSSERKVAELTYHELQGLSRQQGFSVPTIPEVLALCLEKVSVDLEIKEPGYEDEIIRLLPPDARRYVITSFYDKSLGKIKSINKKISTGLLLGKSDPEGSVVITRLCELFPIGRARKIGADFLAPHWRLVNPIFIMRARMANLPIFIWTVNEPAKIKRALRKRLQGIITDAPDVALKLREQMSS